MITLKEITIKKALKQDVEEILQLQKIAYLSEAEIINDFSIHPLHQTLKEILVEFENQIFLKVESKNKIIGSARCYCNKETCYINKLIVDPQYQNSGIGTKLLQKSENEFPNAKRYELFTGQESKRNLHIYQKHGYQIFKTEKQSDALTLVYLEKKQEINPWLLIPASDYEGHMNHPSVTQLNFLAEIFKTAFEKHESNYTALLGCATGNGLQYAINKKSNVIAAIDINPEYLEILKQRYISKIPSLQIVEADLEKYEHAPNSFSLIFAGLIFEYLNPGNLLYKISEWLINGGVMVSILQLPTESKSKVSDSPYPSLKQLERCINLIAMEQFKHLALEYGLKEIESEVLTLKTGKSFYRGTYKKCA